MKEEESVSIEILSNIKPIIDLKFRRDHYSFILRSVDTAFVIFFLRIVLGFL